MIHTTSNKKKASNVFVSRVTHVNNNWLVVGPHSLSQLSFVPSSVVFLYFLNSRSSISACQVIITRRNLFCRSCLLSWVNCCSSSSFKLQIHSFEWSCFSYSWMVLIVTNQEIMLTEVQKGTVLPVITCVVVMRLVW